MRILVTGGGGFLGCVLVRQLLAASHNTVTVLDRFSWGTQPLASVTSSTLRVIAGDIRDAYTVQSACEGQETVIHLAGIVGYPACDADPADADSTNVEGTWILCQEATRRQIPLLFASTGSTYGKVQGAATEATPVSPLTRYGRNKAEAEKLVLAAGGTVLRLATLYGLSPRMRWDLLPNTFAKLGVAGEIPVFDGRARRTFLPVEDAASAFRWAVKQEIPAGVYNVGRSAQNLTKLEVAQHVQTLTGCTITAREGHDPDERDYAVNYDKFAATGWKPTQGFSLHDVVAFARVWRDPRTP